MIKWVANKNLKLLSRPLIFTLSIFLMSFALVGSCSKDSGNNNTGNNTIEFGFTDVTSQAGFNYSHGFMSGGPGNEPQRISGGVAAGDYDKDGWVDLYAVAGDGGSNLLFRNLANGTFQEVANSAGVDVQGVIGAGPTFADYDGDGYLDLFIGGVFPLEEVLLFQNNGDGTFSDATSASMLDAVTKRFTFSAAFGDYDMDGDLDLFMTHWASGSTSPEESSEHLWANNGDGTFTDVSVESGITQTYVGKVDFSFTPNWSDINNDGYLDMLIAGDFGTSQVFINQTDGTFLNTTSDVIDDENGMGATIGDYDNDLDLDWFVSSIYDPNGVAEANWGVSGNRLYRNNGSGVFENVTVPAGVEHGFWGWGSCFADLDNDTYLDLVHVNGFSTGSAVEYFEDPTRVFMSNGNGTFTERAQQLGLDDTGQGRGIVCFDYDKDGDIDIFIANNDQPPRLFRNDGGNTNNFINIKLNGLPPNTEGVGAKIIITASGKSQIRELRAGSNFVSQNPVYAHFGLGSSEVVEDIDIEWLDGSSTNLQDVAANQHLTVEHPLN
jgi:enediyne biosynthesis protein E4